MASRTQTPEEILDEFLEEVGYEVVPLTKEEAREMFDRSAQFALDMSGEEFLERWDAGELRDTELHVRVQMVVSLLPLVRSTDD